MKRMWRIGLVALAAFAVTGITAASASAELPEYMICKKTSKGGHYTSSLCTDESKVETGGEYELEKGLSKKTTFSAKSGRSIMATPETTDKVECKNTTATGEFTGSKQLTDVVIKASGCEAGAAKCASSGLTAGHIMSNALKGELGYIAGKGTSTPTVGLLLSQEASTYATEFNCEGLEIRTKGPLIGEATGNINAISPEAAYTFRQSKGVQQYTSFEGGGMFEDEWRWEFNLGKGWEPEGGDPSGLELTANSSQGMFEIKA